MIFTLEPVGFKDTICTKNWPRVPQSGRQPYVHVAPCSERLLGLGIKTRETRDSREHICGGDVQLQSNRCVMGTPFHRHRIQRRQREVPPDGAPSPQRQRGPGPISRKTNLARIPIRHAYGKRAVRSEGKARLVIRLRYVVRLMEAH